LIALFFAVLPFAAAQNAPVRLYGHMRAEAVAGNDQGRVAAPFTMSHLTLALQGSPEQQADLANLLARQQDASSPDFHRWLTPEQFAERFGARQAEIDQIAAWLVSQNLTVDAVGRGRTTISFSGAVRDVEKAFQTEIHHYSVNGEMHFANASEPSVPATLSGVIRSIRGLHDFRLKPAALRKAAVQPAFAPSANYSPAYTSTTTGRNYLAPDDVSTIYDIAPVYNSGITGKGQTIVVVGQTRINVSDIQQFRTYFNLNSNDPQTLLVPGTTDPGISSADLPEADLDVEWTGATARDATILYVYSRNVDDALTYAIDQDLAPVISMSYGLCEALNGNAYLASIRMSAQQAAAQGISWIAASGDNGANDCYGLSRAPAGLSVDAPASIPEVTGVGGTTLNEGSGTYWNSANNANHASAISYIPETVWNDSVQDGSPSSSGGGASAFFAKPAWQTGPAVPNDGVRDVPDVSLPASADHDAYLVYSTGTLQAYGGTSVGAPVFAGMAALLNQYLTANGLQAAPGIGNMNPRLYTLAQETPGVFHDVTSGDNIVDSCVKTSRTCVLTQVGYNAAQGYDQATGLGSVDAYNLLTAWHPNGLITKAAPAMQLVSSLTNLATTDSTVLTATITGSGGIAPTGTVTFYLAGVSLGSAALAGSGSTATAALTVPGAQLAAGTSAISALYGGDSTYAAVSSTITLTVTSSTALVLKSLNSAASFRTVYAPGMITAMFGQNLASGNSVLQTSPLPTQVGGVTVTVNGIAAPLYYVSPGQINLQIPYEVPAGTAIVKITSNGQTATSQILVTPTAPGIFADGNGLLVPYQSTGRGQTIGLYMTGDGKVSPAAVTGSVPQAETTPAPVGNVTVTIGGVPAAKPFSFIGVPSWSIGVTQLNFTIPANAPLGLQPVVVTVGSGTSAASSAPVYITVTP
jgi:uncharacterized protein (TIGR03437 family)